MTTGAGLGGSTGDVAAGVDGAAGGASPLPGRGPNPGGVGSSSKATGLPAL